MALPNHKELVNKFADAAEANLKRREEAERQHAREERRRAAEKSAKEKAARAQQRANEAANKILLKTFASAKKIYDQAFGVNQTFAVRLEGNSLTFEYLRYPNPEYKGKPEQKYCVDQRYGKKLTASNGHVVEEKWGYMIDPQSRHLQLGVREDRLSEALWGPAMLLGSKEELEKLRALRKSNTAPKPQGPKPR